MTHALRLFVAIAYIFGWVTDPAAAEARVWAIGFHWAVYNEGRGLSLQMISQDESHLVGSFLFLNLIERDQPPRTVEFQGVRTNDVFWPDATLEVKKTEMASWERIGASVVDSTRDTIAVKPGTYCLLSVNFDAFKPFIATHQFGRVVVGAGDAAGFELKYLAPPEEGK